MSWSPVSLSRFLYPATLASSKHRAGFYLLFPLSGVLLVKYLYVSASLLSTPVHKSPSQRRLPWPFYSTIRSSRVFVLFLFSIIRLERAMIIFISFIGFLTMSHIQMRIIFLLFAVLSLVTGTTARASTHKNIYWINERKSKFKKHFLYIRTLY